jgi:hypothetical protein
MCVGGIGHFGGGLLLARLSVDEDEFRRGLEVFRLADGAGGADDIPAAIEKRLGDAQADATGGACDDGDRLFSSVHPTFPRLGSG